MPAAPLAGRPPYATDEDDSIFTTAPLQTRRTAPPKPENPNNRSSAYDVYNDYLPDGHSKENPFQTPTNSSNQLRPPKDTAADASNRQSGVGGIGMGLLNMDYSDSEDEDDDAPAPRKPVAPPAPPAPISPSKNAALLAAIGNIGGDSKSTNSAKANLTPVVPVNASANSRSPPPIAAPRPGYAAPMPATFGQNPFEGGGPPPPQPIGGVPTPISQPSIQIPSAAHARGSPLPLSLSPAPLQAPATPIMPVFALPRKGSGDKEGPGVKFEAGSGAPLPRNKSIMRSQTEDPLLPRRGEKGDDFWRRFSMIAREDQGNKGKKESPWLRKTNNGTNALARWVWVVGLILLLAVVGAIVLGVLFSNKGDQAPKEPTILAGNTSKVAPAAAETAGFASGGGGGAAARVGGGGGGGAPVAGGTTTRSILKVTPTHTIRALPTEDEGVVFPLPTGLREAKLVRVVEGRNGSVERSTVERREARRRHRVRRWD